MSKRSTTRSDTSPPPKAESRPTLLLDQTFSTANFAGMLAGEDWIIELHKNHFKGDAPDHEWIPVCAQRGWMILSCDKRIHRWHTEAGLARRAAIGSCAKVFFLARGSRPLPDYAKAVLAAKRKIFRLAKQNRGGYLFARIHADGRVEALFQDNLTAREKTQQKFGRI